MRRTLLAPYLLVSACHLLAQLADGETVAAVTQVLLMPALALVVLPAADRSQRLVRWTLWGLGWSWLGDTAPRFLDGDPAFQAMIACFLVAQVGFIVGFRPYVDRSVLRRDRRWAVPYLFAWVVLLGLCAPAAGVLAPAVVVYGTCLVGMALLATGVNTLTWAGGAVFVVSDGLIALDAFDVWTQPGHDAWAMGTYCLAQLLLVLGVVVQARDEAGPTTGHHPTVVPAR